MKKLILVSIASLLFSSTYANAEWVKPTKSACTSNGGKFKNGMCKANWQSATNICRASGARLPMKDELWEVATSCGAVNPDLNSVSDFYINVYNSDYQSCYKKRGFSDKDRYWSSTEDDRDSSRAHYLSFKTALGTNPQDKSEKSFALCVRGQ